MGALLFISAGSLELAALDSVEERLVDNAAILGVISLLTGLLFILDLLLASKRRKKTRIVTVKKVGYDKNTQTDDTKLMEVYRSSDMNGNVQNGGHHLNGGFYPDPFPKMGSKKIPKNGVKILPTSPMMEDSYRIPVTNSNNEFVGTITSPLSPPVYAPSDLKTQEAKIRSTESFLRSEKGELPIVRRISDEDRSNGQVFLPPGYMLVPAGQFDLKSQTKPDSRGSTPPGYAKIIVDKTKHQKSMPEYVIIPVDQLEGKKEGEVRKLQSPTVTTTVKTPQGYYYTTESPGMKMVQSAGLHHAASNVSLSDAASDGEDGYLRRPKYSPEYLQMDSKGRKPSPISDDSSDGPKLSYKSYGSKGKVNRGFADKDEVDFASPFQRNTSYRSSSRMTPPEKPKSILRLDHSRSSSKKSKDGGLNFPKDVHYDSLDSRKIAEDLRHLKEITKSDMDLQRDLEKENEMLKEHLRKEKEEKDKLKHDFKMELQSKEEETKKTMAELADRKKLEERLSELEDLRRKLGLGKSERDVEERKKIEQKIKEIEDEKDRRMSEREEQYFGIVDLKQSHKDSSPVSHPKMSDIEDYIRSQTEKEREGAKEINAKLKEKFLEREDKAKEDQELRKIIEEGFYFLDEEEKKKRKMYSPELKQTKPKIVEKKSAPDLTSIYQKSIDSFRKKTPELKPSDEFSRRWKNVTGESPSPLQRSDESDGTGYSPATDEEIPFRGETPASFKSEAQFWLEGDQSKQPTSPRDPGYVLHTAQNWPDSKTPSPQDRFQFSSKKAQKFKISPGPSSLPEQEKSLASDLMDFEEIKKTSPKSQLLDYEETQDEQDKVQGRRKGLLIRKVDFPDEPVTDIRRPVTVAAGSTSTWKKWLQPKPKLQPSKSVPN